jgi:phosphopantetheinyl transferase (holo-ACP synthase)
MSTGQHPRIGVDVVHLSRLGRMHAELGMLFEARLWHPDERMAAEGMNAAGRLRYLAASLAAKEAWIKAAGRRPPGWVFSDARLTLRATAPGHGAAGTEMFAWDMATTTAETGCLHADRRNGSQAPPEGQAVWYGVHDEWLIAGSMTWRARAVPL